MSGKRRLKCADKNQRDELDRLRAFIRRRAANLATIGIALAIVAASPSPAQQRTRVRHFTPNANFDSNGTFLPSKAGFDLADVSTLGELDRLPEGTMGLFWVGQCSGASTEFRSIVEPVIDHSKLFGFYIMDDPDPTGRWRPLCTGSDLRAESDWIHSRRPDAATFIALMNLGSSASPRFGSEYAPENSRIDLFGVGAYPCRTRWTKCDYEMIDRFVAATKVSGIPLGRVVPTYQTFGGGTWNSDGGGGYRLPDASELQTMLERWDSFVPSPVFDFAYSWGRQRDDASLAASEGLQSVIERHNRRSPP